jgi:hypothetical protein
MTFNCNRILNLLPGASVTVKPKSKPSFPLWNKSIQKIGNSGILFNHMATRQQVTFSSGVFTFVLKINHKRVVIDVVVLICRIQKP